MPTLLAGVDDGPGQGAGGRAGLEGAAFSWRTIRGRGVLGLLAGRRRPGINADRDGVPSDVRIVTGDGSLEEEYGLAVLIEPPGVAAPAPDRHGVTWHLDRIAGPDSTASSRQRVHRSDDGAQSPPPMLAAPPRRRRPWVSPPGDGLARRGRRRQHLTNSGVHQQCEGFTTLRSGISKANTALPLLRSYVLCIRGDQAGPA